MAIILVIQVVATLASRKTTKKTHKEDKDMSRIFLITAMTVTLVAMGCGGPLYGSHNDYSSGNWWGWANNKEAHEWLVFSKEEKEIYTANLLQEKLQAAIINGNGAKITNTLSIIKQIEETLNSTPNCRKLKFRNEITGYIVKVESSPFDGIALAPGQETSEAFCIPIGLYVMEYKKCKITPDGPEACSRKNRRLSVVIDRSRINPLVIYQ